MATWDSADLLQRARDEAQEPLGGTPTTDTQWYSLLTASQLKVYRMLAATVPHANVGAPAALTTSDGGLTYAFPSSVFPLGYCVVREGLDGRVLWSGTETSWSADFVFEGDQLRTPNGQARTYSNGVYARYITMPAAISASAAPSLTPDWARILIVFDAVCEWAGQGGLRDPEPWRVKFNKAWSGDPEALGDIGVLGALRTQLRYQGVDGTRGRRW